MNNFCSSTFWNKLWVVLFFACHFGKLQIHGRKNPHSLLFESHQSYSFLSLIFFGAFYFSFANTPARFESCSRVSICSKKKELPEASGVSYLQKVWSLFTCCLNVLSLAIVGEAQSMPHWQFVMFSVLLPQRKPRNAGYLTSLHLASAPRINQTSLKLIINYSWLLVTPGESGKDQRGIKNSPATASFLFCGWC